MCADRILVADSSRARIFALDNWQAPLREIRDFIHPQCRASGRDLLADQPGRSFDSFGAGRHALETDVTVKQQEARNFSRQVAGYLNLECSKGKIDRLYLIAAPGFLGLLRSDLSKQARQLVIREIDKNLVQQDAEFIREQLRLH